MPEVLGVTVGPVSVGGTKGGWVDGPRGVLPEPSTGSFTAKVVGSVELGANADETETPVLVELARACAIAGFNSGNAEAIELRISRLAVGTVSAAVIATAR